MRRLALTTDCTTTDHGIGLVILDARSLQRFQRNSTNLCKRKVAVLCGYLVTRFILTGIYEVDSLDLFGYVSPLPVSSFRRVK